jgi:hypothetical protein
MTDEAAKHDDPPGLTLIEHMALNAVDRAHMMRLKGKARDNEVIALFVGAALALRVVNKQDHNFEGWVGLVLCIRGYLECVHVAAEAYNRGCTLPETLGGPALEEVLKKARALGGRKV